MAINMPITTLALSISMYRKISVANHFYPHCSLEVTESKPLK